MLKSGTVIAKEDGAMRCIITVKTTCRKHNGNITFVFVLSLLFPSRFIDGWQVILFPVCVLYF